MSFEKLMKFTFFALLGLGILTFHRLDGNCGCGCGFSGVYIGGSVGYVSSVSKYVQEFPVRLGFVRNDLGIEGVDGGIHLGFGGAVTQGTGPVGLYIGVETSALLIGARGTLDIQAFNPSTGGIREQSQRANISNYIDLSVRIGLPVYNFAMPYIKVGGNTARWDIQHVLSPDLMAIGYMNNGREKNLSGWFAAIGAEVLLPSGAILGVEVAHSIYKKQEYPLSNPLIIPEVDPEAHVSFTPQYTRAALRLSYLF